MPFSSRFTVSTRREIYPFKWHVPTTRDPLARKPSETVFENSSRQTRVKKKEKKKRKGKEEKGFSPLLSVIGLWHGRFSFSCGFALSSIILLYGMILLERPIYSIYRLLIKTGMEIPDAGRWVGNKGIGMSDCGE